MEDKEKLSPLRAVLAQIQEAHPTGKVPRKLIAEVEQAQAGKQEEPLHDHNLRPRQVAKAAKGTPSHKLPSALVGSAPPLMGGQQQMPAVPLQLPNAALSHFVLPQQLRQPALPVIQPIGVTMHGFGTFAPYLQFNQAVWQQRHLPPAIGTVAMAAL